MPVPAAHRAVMGSSPALGHLGSAELDRVYDLGSVQTIPDGQILVEHGRLGMEAYLILSGTVSVELPDGARDTSGPGEMVGEMALLGEDTNRRNATATAVGEVVVLVINRHYFESLVRENAQLAESIRERIRLRARSRR